MVIAFLWAFEPKIASFGQIAHLLQQWWGSLLVWDGHLARAQWEIGKSSSEQLEIYHNDPELATFAWLWLDDWFIYK